MNQPSFLIVGANFINKGAEAMLKTVAYEIKKRHRDPIIYCICHQEENEIARRQGIIPLYMEYTNADKLLKKVTGKLKRIVGGKPVPFADYSPMNKIEKISNLKAAIDVSGFAYGDKRGYVQPLETIKVINFCKRVGASYIFMPQAWGSFKEQDVAENCREMLLMADKYFARDDVSRKYLAELLKKPIDAIPLMPDIALHFPIPTLDGMEILSKAGYVKTPGRKAVTISPNMRVYERSGQNAADNTYVKLLTNIINKLKSEYDIILVPNEIRPGRTQGKDDQFLCKTLYNQLSDKSGVYYFDGYYSAEEIKAVIKATDVVIASRFHSLVFALSLGIPCVAISWAHKYRELFKLFGMEDFVVEDTKMNEAAILQLFERLTSEYSIWQNNILNVLPELKKRNAEVFDLLN
jgi:colanic acid/amylovoran biosynthesis protein